jgi:hypothetical protein
MKQQEEEEDLVQPGDRTVAIQPDDRTVAIQPGVRTVAISLSPE